MALILPFHSSGVLQYYDQTSSTLNSYQRIPAISYKLSATGGTDECTFPLEIAKIFSNTLTTFFGRLPPYNVDQIVCDINREQNLYIVSYDQNDFRIGKDGEVRRIQISERKV